MLRLVGEDDADGAAARVMALETALAKGHWTTVDSRDALKTYNKHDPGRAVEALAPGFAWRTWLDALGPPDGAFAEVVVRQPPRSRPRPRLLAEVPLDDWKAWLTFHHVHSTAPFLSSRFVDANFAFYGTLLSGIPELRERWKRGVAVLEGALGEAVGQLYVPATSRPSTRPTWTASSAGWSRPTARTSATLEWMSPETRQAGAEKLDKFTPKVGYPDTWRDYSSWSSSATTCWAACGGRGVRGRPQPDQDRRPRSTATSGT